MPRYYAKQESFINFAKVLEAIKEVKIHKMSIRQITAAHKIPSKQFSTVHCKVE